MWKLLKKLLFFWRWGKKTGPIVIEYGRYVYKPVIARAMSMVMGISQEELINMINNGEEVYLNDERIHGSRWAMHPRLESGQYEIKMPTKDKVWRFYIA